MATKCYAKVQFANTPRYFNNLNDEQKRQFMDSFDTVFCDCDGVIWQTLRDPITGSGAAIDYLREKGKQVTFVTNNSISTMAEQLKKFERCNISVKAEDIVYPPQTVCNYLKSINFQGLIFCITTTQFKDVLREAGFHLVEEENRIIPETLQDFREAIYSKDPVKAVIIDVDFNLTAAKLMRAHLHLKDPECLLLGGAADVLLPFEGGDIIGSGPFINVVENSSKRNARILGKPGIYLCEMLKQRFNLKDTRRALFIGDSLTSDIRFGKMCGFQTLLVLSGGTKESDLHTITDEIEMPDYVTNSLADLNGIL